MSKEGQKFTISVKATQYAKMSNPYGSVITGTYIADSSVPSSATVTPNILSGCTDIWRPILQNASGWQGEYDDSPIQWFALGGTEELYSDRTIWTSTGGANVLGGRQIVYASTRGTSIGLFISCYVDDPKRCYIVASDYGDRTQLFYVRLSATGEYETFMSIDSNLTIGGGDDPVVDPSLPSFDVFRTGLVRMYLFSADEASRLDELGNFIWGTGDISLEKIAKSLFNPFDAIISMNYIPTNLNSIRSSSDADLIIGNLDTGMDCRYATTQWVSVDMGTISIPTTYGNFLDYEPYTKVQLFLPYIGVVTLDTNEVMGKLISINYKCDIITGVLIAVISVDGNVRYQFDGSFNFTTPVTGQYYANFLNGIMQVGGGVMSVGTGNVVGGAMQTLSSAVQMATPTYERSGNVSSVSGFIGVQKAYAIVTRPNPLYTNDSNYNALVGRPYGRTARLSTLSGFTVVSDIHLENMSCTDAELDEIESLLKEGVIF